MRLNAPLRNAPQIITAMTNSSRNRRTGGLAAVTTLLCWLAASCAEPNADAGLETACNRDDMICGRINEDFSRAVDSALAHPTQIAIRSYGGDSHHGLVIAGRILASNASGRVVDICASACLEEVLPAFETVALIDAPLIAAHGNIRMKSVLARSAGVDMSRCPLPELYTSALERTLADRIIAGNPQRQIEALGITNVARESGEPQRCPILTWDSTADFWAPTRDELVEWFGVRAEGDTAADRPDLIQSRLNCHFPEGTRVRVRDDILVSDGHDGLSRCNPEASHQAAAALRNAERAAERLGYTD